MAQLGNQTTGFSFSVSGSFGDGAGGGPYTVPSPGILVSTIHAYVGNNGVSNNGRLYVWQDSGGKPSTWLVRGASTFGFPGTPSWQAQSSLAINSAFFGNDTSGFIPGGTGIWIGFYSSTGEWAAQGSGTGTTELGNTSDGNWSDHGPAGGGMGTLAAYIDYSLVTAIAYGDASGSGAVHTPVAIWYGDASGNGTPHKVAGVWVPSGAGVKRIW